MKRNHLSYSATKVRLWRMYSTTHYSPKAKYTVPFQFHKFDGKWYLHECDKDNLRPSCPHLHSCEYPMKIDIYEGRLYDVRIRRYTGERIKSSDLKKLWEIPEFVASVFRERDRYLVLHRQDPVRYPNLPSIPAYANRCLVTNKTHTRYKQLIFARLRLQRTYE